MDALMDIWHTEAYGRYPAVLGRGEYWAGTSGRPASSGLYSCGDGRGALGRRFRRGGMCGGRSLHMLRQLALTGDRPVDIL